TETDISLIAAPGVLQRLRLWGVQLLQRQNTPAGSLSAFAQQLSPLLTLALLATTAGHPDDLVQFPGGLALATNPSLRLATFGSVASMTFHAAAWYTTEYA